MASDDVFETTCPNCFNDFDVAGDQAQGTCPHCGAVLKFLNDVSAPPPEPPMGGNIFAHSEPEPTPGQDYESRDLDLELEPVAEEPVEDAEGVDEPEPAPPFQPEAAPTAEPVAEEPFEDTQHADEPEPAPPFQPDAELEPEPSGFPVECPSCQSVHHVEENVSTGACPACAIDLVYDNDYGPTTLEVPSSCPRCHSQFSVPLRSHEGSCPHCSASLRFEDVDEIVEGPSQQTSAEPVPEPKAAPPALAEDVDPVREVDSVPSTGADANDEANQEPEEPLTAESSPTGSRPPLARPRAPDEPIERHECPSCSKEFAVPPKEKEGNCPHCNAPLAFMSEREYEELLEAERKKQEMRERVKERERQRRQREDERLERLRRRREQKQAQADEAAGASEESLQDQEIPAAASRQRRLLRRRAAAKGAGTPQPASVQDSDHPQVAFEEISVAEPAQEPGPAAIESSVEMADVERAAQPGPKKKGLFGRRRKETPQPAAQPDEAVIEVEEVSTSQGPEEAPVTMEVAMDDVVDLPAEPTTPPAKAEKKSRVKAEAKEPTGEAPAGVESDIQVEGLVDDLVASQTAAEGAEAKKSKKGWLGLGRRSKKSNDDVDARPEVEASIDSEFSINGSNEEPAPTPASAASTKSKTGKAPKAAPKESATVEADVAGIDVDLGASASSSESEDEVPKKRLFDRLRKARQDVGEAETAQVELGGVELDAAAHEDEDADSGGKKSGRRSRKGGRGGSSQSSNVEASIEF